MDPRGTQMPGIGELVLGSAPIFGGVAFALAASRIKGPDPAGAIKADLDLVERLPPDQEARRAALERTIELRIDDLAQSTEESRRLREIARSYEGNWRDIVLFAAAVLFAVIWWLEVSHHRTNWLPMFILLILLSMVTAVYAVRGSRRAVRQLLRRRRP